MSSQPRHACPHSRQPAPRGDRSHAPPARSRASAHEQRAGRRQQPGRGGPRPLRALSRPARSRSTATLLVERFLPLARQLARRYQRPEEPFDDLFQVACLGPGQGDRPLRPRRARSRSPATPSRRSSARSSATSATAPGRCACPRDLQELALKVDRTVAELSSDLQPRSRPWPRSPRSCRHRGAGRPRGARGLGRLPRDVAATPARHEDEAGDTLGDTVGTEERASASPRPRDARAAHARRSPRASARCCGCASRRTSPRPRSASASASRRCRSRGIIRQSIARLRTVARTRRRPPGVAAARYQPAPPAAPRRAGRAAARTPTAADTAASSRRSSASSGSSLGEREHEQPERLARDHDGTAHACRSSGHAERGAGRRVEPRRLAVAQRARRAAGARRRSPRAGAEQPAAASASSVEAGR